MSTLITVRQSRSIGRKSIGIRKRIRLMLIRFHSKYCTSEKRPLEVCQNVVEVIQKVQ
jgi:hypothetical protein